MENIIYDQIQYYQRALNNIRKHHVFENLEVCLNYEYLKKSFKINLSSKKK